MAQKALAIARQALSPYSVIKSRHDFTQAQLFAILVLRQFFQTDYRGITQLLDDLPQLRQTLELKKVTHYTTIQKAQQRLIKKGLGTNCKLPFLPMQRLPD